MKVHEPKELRRTITLFGAVALAVGIVVGAGMLVLPGIVYHRAGGWAIWSWLIDAALVVPLLVILSNLGRRFPSAGGVAGFVTEAFPGAAVGVSYVLLGTFALGIPAIALTGAAYLVESLAPQADHVRLATACLAAVMLGTALLASWAGARVAGLLQNTVVTLLVGCLAVIVIASGGSWHQVDFRAAAPDLSGVWEGAALAFFAFTGWEMLAFTAEEFKNPRRDFPLAVGLGFLLVTALYIGVSLAVQALVPLDSPRLATAPLLVVADRLSGGLIPLGAFGLLAGAIILTNLNGACWAASRLTFDIGRKGWAPRAMGLQTLSGAAATPRAAVAWLAIVFALVLGGYGLGYWSLEFLLRTAGQNFFLLYMACVVVFFRLAPSAGQRLFGLLALAACLAFAKIFGWGLLYAMALFAAPYLLRGLGAQVTGPLGVGHER